MELTECLLKLGKTKCNLEMIERSLSIPEVITEIFKKHLAIKINKLSAITGFGLVNKVYHVTTKFEDYIIRLNEGTEKLRYEFPKEGWCLEAAAKVGIPSPQCLSLGFELGFTFMIQNNIEGINGQLLAIDQQLEVWRTLGHYVKLMGNIKVRNFGDRIVDYTIYNAAFDDRWERYLSYNLNMLNEKDPLYQHGHFSGKEHNEIKQLINTLGHENLSFGLVHGDLSCRNVIVAKDNTYLLDWGTAESHVYPHMEIGLVKNNDEVDQAYQEAFFQGLGYDQTMIQQTNSLINKLYLLKRLDKYRWAEGHNKIELERYVEAIRLAFANIG